MRMKGIGGLPVVVKGGKKIIGNISMRDIQFLLVVPEIYKAYRCESSIKKNVVEVEFLFLFSEIELYIKFSVFCIVAL